MAVLLTIEGQYTTPSTVAGKKDVEDYDFEMAYPLSFDIDDEKEVRAASFFIKNFFAYNILKKKFKAKFKGIRSMKITVAEPMDDDSIRDAVSSGDLVAINPYSLTASDVNKMKADEISWSLVMLDGDNTSEISKKKSMWISGNISEKQTALKMILGIKEAAEAVVVHDNSKKSALFSALGESSPISKEDMPKAASKPRKPRKTRSATVEVSE